MVNQYKRASDTVFSVHIDWSLYKATFQAICTFNDGAVGKSNDNYIGKMSTLPSNS